MHAISCSDVYTRSLKTQAALMASAAVLAALNLPRGFIFRPDDEIIVRRYLLPRACGRAVAIPGVVIEDDGTSASLPPWELLAHHSRPADNEAYFFVRVGGGDDSTKTTSRGCGGGWTWVSQRRTPDEVLRLPGGEEVSWNMRTLNLHRGRGRSGSTGWVMHEYTITSPPCPCPVKLCHVAFTGHGQKRQRVPDGTDDAEHRTRQRQRAAATASPASEARTAATTFVHQDQDLQERFLNNQQQHGFDQEQLQISYGGPSASTSRGSLVGSSQETFPGTGQQELAYNQHQLQNNLYEAFGELVPVLKMGAAQEQLQSYEVSSALTFGGSDIGSSQENLPGQQELAYNDQQQSQYNSFAAYASLLGSDIVGASQEPPAGQPFTEEQMRQQHFNHHLGIPANAETAYHDEQFEMAATAPNGETGMMPLLMDQESPLPSLPCPWNNLDAFCELPEDWSTTETDPEAPGSDDGGASWDYV